MYTAAKAGFRTRKFDFMAGSERMLKVHHKNAVFCKSLENKKTYLDNECHKSLSKIQQDIYDIYFNEYLPLKEQSAMIQDVGKLPLMKLPKQQLYKSVHKPDNTTKLPLLSVASRMSKQDWKVKNLSSFESLLQTKDDADKFHGNSKLPPLLHSSAAGNLSGNMYSRKCSLWHDFVTDNSDSTDMDEKRLEIIKAAIALSSEPPKTPERKRRKLRKSFLVNLRRQSKMVWEKEMLQRIGTICTHSKPCEDVKDESAEEDIAEEELSPTDAVMQWRPSLSRNKIMNEDESGTEGDEEDFHFVDRVFQGGSMTSLASSERMRSTRRRSTLNDAPVDDLEDLYYSESSPDIFSVISEHTGSSYTEDSYTSDRDVSSGSFYSSYSDY